MKQLKNKKGMTLIEIVVVLLMMSILLVVVGSLILNSFNYFDKTSNQDASKRTLDSVSDFVRSELLYASDVRVAQEKPDEEDWKVFYVKDKRLYHNDQALYSEGFYNRKNLEMKIRGYDSYRLDINYALFDSENEKTYSTKDTLELLNLKITAEADKTFNPFTNISTMITISETNKIYYKEGMKPIEDDPQPEDPTKGTVADQMNCLTLHNNRFEFKDTRYVESKDEIFIYDENYRVGEMVHHNDAWWMKVVATNGESPEPGNKSRRVWKKISAEFDNSSYYSVGDIVIFEKNYYICNKEMEQVGILPNPDTPYDTYFKKFEGELPDNKGVCPLLDQSNPNKKYLFIEREDSIIYKLQQFIDNGFSLDDVPEYDPNKVDHYPVIDKITSINDFVKVKDETLGIYRYYIKLMEHSSPTHPGTISNRGEKGLSWQEIKTEWDPFSAYKDDDLIYFPKNSGDAGFGYYEADEDVHRYGVFPDRYDNKNPWDIED